MRRLRLQLTLIAALCFVIPGLALLAVQLTGTTTAEARESPYDGPAVAHVDAHDIEAVDAGTALLSGTRERTAWPSVDALGGSTTSTHSLNATEAGGARFVVNSAGDALDTARVTIPGGKYNTCSRTRPNPGCSLIRWGSIRRR
jgi:hypothetical protein